MKNIKIKLACIAIIIIILIAILPILKSNFYSFTSPDENSVVNFATHPSEEIGKINFNETGLENQYKIASRGSSPDKYNNVLSTKFYGLSMILASLKILGNQHLDIVLIIFYILSFLVIFKISTLLFTEKIKRLVLVIATFAIPSLYYWFAKGFFEDIPSVFFLLMGLWYFIKNDKLEREENNNNLSLCYLFFGIAVFIKPLYLLYVLPFCLISVTSLKKQEIKKSILPLLFFIIFIGTLLILNWKIYGSPLITGPSLMYSGNILVSTNQTLLDRISIFFYDWIQTNQVFPFLIIAAILSCTIPSKKINRKLNIIYILSILLFSIYLFSFSGAVNFLEINSSVYRYLLFSQIFSIIIILNNLKISSRKVKLISLFVIIILCIFTIANNQNTINPIIKQRENAQNITESFYKYLSEHDIQKEEVILLTDGFDKYFFPYIKTVIINKDFSQQVYKKENPFTLCEVTKEYLGKNYTIIIFGNDLPINLEQSCLNNLSKKSTLTQINNYPARIIQKDEINSPYI